MSPAEFRLAVFKDLGAVYVGPLDDLSVGCVDDYHARTVRAHVPPEVPVFVLGPVTTSEVPKTTALTVRHRGVQRYEQTIRETKGDTKR